MSFFSSTYKPTRAAFADEAAFGPLATQFEAYAPDRNLKKPQPVAGSYPIIKPSAPLPFTPVQTLITRMIEATWKNAEPSQSAKRGPVTIGTRGAAAPAGTANDVYHPQKRPIAPTIYKERPDPTAIASDWKLFNAIERTNAVTFRGDGRGPLQINAHGGFTPPNSRTDRYYLENNIYKAFAGYVERRYGRTLDKQAFLDAVDQVLTDDTSKKLLTDYMMWKKIVEREAVNLGRMTQDECLKGYISTSRSVPVAVSFASRNSANGWVYVTLVSLGFVVPTSGDHQWFTGEQEIAQWGPIPFAHIVGARQLSGFKAVGPIYFRPEFRAKEPKAFTQAFQALNAMVMAGDRR